MKSESLHSNYSSLLLPGAKEQNSETNDVLKEEVATAEIAQNRCNSQFFFKWTSIKATGSGRLLAARKPFLVPLLCYSVSQRFLHIIQTFPAGLFSRIQLFNFFVIIFDFIIQNWGEFLVEWWKKVRKKSWKSSEIAVNTQRISKNPEES